MSIILVAAGAWNFFSFMAECERLGGDALNGYESNGHFYVSEHGQSKEVSEKEWKHSRLHAISVFVTHPLALLSMAYLLFQHVFPAFIYGMDSEAIRKAERVVCTSGAPIANIKCAGKIGMMRFSGPLLEVTVYPNGLLVKPVFMTAFGIPRAQIRDVTNVEKRWQKGVEITHSSTQIASPVFLRCERGSSVVSAIEAMVHGNRVS